MENNPLFPSPYQAVPIKIHGMDKLTQRKNLLSLEHKINRQLIKNNQIQKDFDNFVSHAISSINNCELFEEFLKRYDKILERIINTT